MGVKRIHHVIDERSVPGPREGERQERVRNAVPDDDVGLFTAEDSPQLTPVPEEPREPRDERQAEHRGAHDADSSIRVVLVDTGELLPALEDGLSFPLGPVDVVIDHADIGTVRRQPLQEPVMNDGIAADPVGLLRGEDPHTSRWKVGYCVCGSRLRTTRPSPLLPALARAHAMSRRSRSRQAYASSATITSIPPMNSGVLDGVDRYSAVRK